jgi:CHAD domain-containing protein
MTIMNLDLMLIDQVDQDFGNTPVTLTDYIYPAIQKQYVTVLTLESAVLADDDVEAVHQMRVSLRRLRSQIRAFGSVLDIPKVMGERAIAKIARVLGKVRDLDVLQQTFKNHQLNLPEAERIQLEKVTAIVSKRRRKEILKVKLMLNDREYQYFKLGINNWLNNPQYLSTAQAEIQSILPDLLLASVSSVFLCPGWYLDLDPEADRELAVAQTIMIHSESLHSLRKQVKAARYLLEMFADRYPPRYRDYLKDLKLVHQLFGNIQDNLVLDQFIRKVLGKRAPTKLPTLYSRISRSNQLSWEAWEPIQLRYRKSELKQELQLLLIKDTISPLHG